jgi:hypothetical protein
MQPSSSSTWTASSTNGSETVTQEGAKSWNDSASGSFLTNEEVCGDLDFVLARIGAELRLPFN